MFLRILDHEVSVPIMNSFDVKLHIFLFWHPFSHFGFLFTISWSRSYFQGISGAPIHLKLLCTFFLHNPIGVRCTLVYHYCWFPCSILPVLHPNWCTREQFLLLPLRLIALPPDEFMGGLVHFWCTKCTGQLGQVLFPWCALCHQLQR